MNKKTKCYCGHTDYCDCGPLEELKQETLEEFAENYGWRIKTNSFSDRVKANELAESAKQDFINGAKWQAERMYSEEEVYKLLCNMPNFFNMTISQQIKARYEWFEQFNKTILNNKI